MRKGVSPFSEKSLKRNKDLREILLFIGATPNQSIAQVIEHFGWAEGKTRSAFELLVAYGLLQPTSRNPSTQRVYYSTLEHTPGDLDRLLPIVCPPDAKLIRQPTKVGRPKAKKPEVQLHCDPLIALLMGGGRAPSLNFMDSTEGAEYAESQAAGQAN